MSVFTHFHAPLHALFGHPTPPVRKWDSAHTHIHTVSNNYTPNFDFLLTQGLQDPPPLFRIKA